MESSKKQVRWAVFLVPWILAIITIILNFASGEAFNGAIMTITNFILAICLSRLHKAGSYECMDAVP